MFAIATALDLNSARARRSMTSPGDGSQRVVLVVEDDPNVRQTLRRMLSLNGYSVRVAPTAAEAIDVARLEHLTAAVLDLGLEPDGMSGLHVLSWLRSQPQYADLPVIIFTGRVDLPQHVDEQIRRHRAHLAFKPQAYQALIDQLVRLTAPAG
jgi:CheY-like chemotaxis protein